MGNFSTVSGTRFLSAWISALLLMTGCSATGVKFSPTETIEPGKSIVYIYRKKRMVGAANQPHVFLNGNHVSQLLNGGYSYSSVEPGDVVLCTLQRFNSALVGHALLSRLLDRETERLRIRAGTGETYYVRFNVVGHRMVLVEKAEGRKDIEGLRLCVDQGKGASSP
jgi:hypothetical protein